MHQQLIKLGFHTSDRLTYANSSIGIELMVSGLTITSISYKGEPAYGVYSIKDLIAFLEKVGDSYDF